MYEPPYYLLTRKNNENIRCTSLFVEITEFVLQQKVGHHRLQGSFHVLLHYRIWCQRALVYVHTALRDNSIVLLAFVFFTSRNWDLQKICPYWYLSRTTQAPQRYVVDSQTAQNQNKADTCTTLKNSIYLDKISFNKGSNCLLMYTACSSCGFKSRYMYYAKNNMQSNLP
jgi:hypothetical protein